MPKNSKKPNSSYTHNFLVGLQAHLMDHINIASASEPLSHSHRDNDGYIKKSILTQKQVTQVLMRPK